MSTEKSKTIIVAPLSWGLGHATRCIPLIRNFLQQQNRVIICTYGEAEALLKKEFPQLEFITVEGIRAAYAPGKNMAWKLLLQLPRFFRSIKHEHDALQKIIDNKNPDIVISDNRYGFNSKKIPCYFITHQVFIRAGIFSFAVNLINHYYLRKYTGIWVPDHADEKNNFSGALGHGKTKLPLKYIGPLSRFSREESRGKKYKYCAVISGPEPQRTIFEGELFAFLKEQPHNSVMVTGKPNESFAKEVDHVSVFSHLPTEELKEVLLSSEIILCRPGYTSVMELASLEKRVVFFATPGQTEQEYLEKKLNEELYSGEQISFNGKKRPVVDFGKINI